MFLWSTYCPKIPHAIMATQAPKLLNAHRWYYTLCAHADDLIPVRLRCFFFFSCSMPMSAHDLLLTGASLCSTFQDVICATFMPTSPVFCQSPPWSASFLCKFTTPQGSRWDEGLSEGRVVNSCAVVSRDFEHMVSHPESGKSSTFSCLQFLPTYFMAGFRA